MIVARSRQMYIKLAVEALAYHPFYLGSELTLVGVRKPYRSMPVSYNIAGPMP